MPDVFAGETLLLILKLGARVAYKCNGLRSILQLADGDSTSTLSLRKERKKVKIGFPGVLST